MVRGKGIGRRKVCWEEEGEVMGGRAARGGRGRVLRGGGRKRYVERRERWW